MKYLLIGLVIALLEEFITQGVLKDNPLGWIVPTFIAFTPFLLIMILVGRIADKKLSARGAAIACYAVAGGIGLAFEWFVMGLTPWPDFGILQLLFQFGMFSFWIGVGFAPRLMLDRRPTVRPIAKACRWSLIVGFTVIYILTFTAPRESQFGVGIISVIAMFSVLQVLYVLYALTLKHR